MCFQALLNAVSASLGLMEQDKVSHTHTVTSVRSIPDCGPEDAKRILSSRFAVLLDVIRLGLPSSYWLRYNVHQRKPRARVSKTVCL